MTLQILTHHPGEDSGAGAVDDLHFADAVQQGVGEKGIEGLFGLFGPHPQQLDMQRCPVALFNLDPRARFRLRLFNLWSQGGGTQLFEGNAHLHPVDGDHRLLLFHRENLCAVGAVLDPVADFQLGQWRLLLFDPGAGFVAVGFVEQLPRFGVFRLFQRRQGPLGRRVVAVLQSRQHLALLFAHLLLGFREGTLLAPELFAPALELFDLPAHFGLQAGRLFDQFVEPLLVLPEILPGFFDDVAGDPVALGGLESVTLADASLQKGIGRTATLFVVKRGDQLHLLFSGHQRGQAFVVGRHHEGHLPPAQLLEQNPKEARRFIGIGPQLDLVDADQGVTLPEEFGKLQHPPREGGNVVLDRLGIVDDRFDALVVADAGLGGFATKREQILAHPNRREDRFEQHRLSPGVDSRNQDDGLGHVDADGHGVLQGGVGKIPQDHLPPLVRQDKFVIPAPGEAYPGLIVIEAVELPIQIAQESLPAMQNL